MIELNKKVIDIAICRMERWHFIREGERFRGGTTSSPISIDEKVYVLSGMLRGN